MIVLFHNSQNEAFHRVDTLLKLELLLDLQAAVFARLLGHIFNRRGSLGSGVVRVAHRHFYLLSVASLVRQLLRRLV